MRSFIATLDQGTTSSQAMIFHRDQHIIGKSQREY